MSNLKITALVENTSSGNLKAVHGLSFYIETQKHKILFDLGPNGTVFENAKKKNIDLSAVDTVIISHGHYDHGGALKEFLKINSGAKIYVQKSAFEPHYSKALFFRINIGLDRSVMNNPNVVLLDGDYKIDDELTLFVSKVPDTFRSEANNALLAGKKPDDFRHEQNLLIRGGKDVLITGCGHSGVISILRSVSDTEPGYCIGGFHVYNPVNRKTVPLSQLETLSESLNDYVNTEFYTCHCTGTKAYNYLSGRHSNVHYISCGDEIEI